MLSQEWFHLKTHMSQISIIRGDISREVGTSYKPVPYMTYSILKLTEFIQQC
jgi:hypothetical protein